MSCKLLNFLIDQNSLDYDTPDVSFVESLIRGSTPTASDRSWMYDIVHNSRNGVDVDKFDYLARDAFMLGIKNSCDFARLMAYSKVIGGAVCYHVKEAYGVYEMFHARYTLFRRVYSHRVAKAIDYMVADALTLADPYLHISDCLNDPERFSALTDGILRNIEFSTAPECSPPTSPFIPSLNKQIPSHPPLPSSSLHHHQPGAGGSQEDSVRHTKTEPVQDGG
eukprot:TRINITY_DN174_c0_g4_i2.p1 TRINITY_DN174_c0_g4~~TRINITY_DN174_c0_g4_i2.p1  ORF type:complete len:237 (-),score=69.55 TRINITY_DN174_c0_g4_i2:602-1270(-)